jgi:hypothetical protein
MAGVKHRSGGDRGSAAYSKALSTRSGLPPIPRERIAAIVEREIEARNDEEGEGGVRALVAQMVAARPALKYSTAERMIYRIRTGHATDRHGEAYVQDAVLFDTADLVLTALDLVDLWHTELADLYEVDAVPVGAAA